MFFSFIFQTETKDLKDLLDAYCDHVDDFHGKLQEVLSKSALRVRHFYEMIVFYKKSSPLKLLDLLGTYKTY